MWTVCRIANCDTRKIILIKLKMVLIYLSIELTIDFLHTILYSEDNPCHVSTWPEKALVD